MHTGPKAELWALSAAELASAYREGRATPADVLAAILARIERVNPSVNAVVTLDQEGAAKQARASTERFRNGAPLGPLDGIPLTVKDNILVAGLRATWGSRLYAEYVPEADEPPIDRLRAGGAIILGKTNVPEFTLQGYTDNALFGPTRNPYDLALTPGGSSGGAVAAVATGMGPIAIGTDGGGSIRRPAAHTGLVGFKPSRDMVPRGKGFPAILHDLEVIGPIARNVGDILLAMDVIGGPDWRPRAPDARAARILYIPTFSGAPVDPVIAAAVAEAAVSLAQRGHSVETAHDFDLAAPIADIWPVISETGAAWLMSLHGDRDDMIGPALAEMARNGRSYSAADYLAALDTIKAVARDFDSLFQRFDYLLTPAAAAMPWPATEVYPPTIDGQRVGPRGHAIFTPFVNALGLPALSMPAGQSADGLPIGLQLVAARGRDAELLAFTRASERSIARGGLAPDVA
ncbi:amidase [Pseudorhodoplanes sp.]|uniref:amidase n=1 Tax=Pseudorhodoplanes sp. TaxID=1934341 RepID=UPI002C605DF6|nr:amidase [Pseudorhodoplanes sp.]HWV51494.1 amidase [Pseudorhodoplanes sp.]